MANWFDVDRVGLAKLVADRGMSFVVFELLQNTFDEDGVSQVEVRLDPIAGRPEALLEVMDDSPTGFRRLSDAWTLFAESYKKDKPEKRGRFNLGEKLVLALCEEAHIVSTTGSIHFTGDGRLIGRQKREKGTLFQARLRMTREQYQTVCYDIGQVIPPAHITIKFNGEELAVPREFVTRFECVLPTVIADAEGNLTRTSRTTQVELYRPLPDEVAMIYEMGIPVVATGDTFHVNVMQKVPLNMDRDNVTPAYLRHVRVEVVNHTSHLIDEKRAASTEVKEATSDSRATPQAVAAMLDKTHGERRFTFDPSDPEANTRLQAGGYIPVMGGSLTAGQWDNVRKHNLSAPAGTLVPSPKCYSESGSPEKVLSPGKYTQGMRNVVTFARDYAMALMAIQIDVKIVIEPMIFWSANYGGSHLTLNLGRLGHRFFSEFPQNLQDVMDLLIHEFGHEYSGNHLSEEYFHALTRIGARSTILALAKPGLFPIREESSEPRGK
jgi:hypothetical protein